MLSIPDTHQHDLAPLKSTLAMPYTLTPGNAVGVFLAELGKGRIVGSKFKSGIIIAPAQDFCPKSGESEFEFVEVPSTGSLNGFTKTATGVIGLIRLDGADFDFVHRIIDADFATLKIGDRVTASFADGVENSILAIVGFKVTPGAPMGAVRPLGDPEKQIEVIPYNLDLHYNHAFGPYYGRMFDEIKHNRKIYGTRMPEGERAFLPPREVCDVTHKKSGAWAEVKDTGTVRAMSIIHLEFVGQTRKPPYIYAEITLDGSATRLIHTVACPDMSQAKELVKPGTRVRAVWSDKRTGSLSTDISHFEIISE